MKNYVVFPTYGNVDFAEVIEKRSHELGYEGNSKRRDISITLCTTDGDICWTPEPETYPNKGDEHELGDLKRLFTTEDYKFNRKPKIRIGNHEVEFKKNGINVGCQFVSKDIILEIAREFQSDED